MGSLKERLMRIKESRPSGNTNADKLPAPSRLDGAGRDAAQLSSFGPEWEGAGLGVLKRGLLLDGLCSSYDTLSRALAVIVPDMLYYAKRTGRMPSRGELVFFDLETTGLSGGAGTVAFLAAFGRFSESGLLVNQYLLLDFPGESDFLEAVLNEFSQTGSRGNPPVVVSFNGKTFDSQILKTRCLMNGFPPPEYFHADLLHPCRRLWKKTLPDCSQGTIETKVLTLDRSGDIPGALAPEIWFSFLKTGDTAALVKICDHNLMDIRGMAKILLCLEEIASSPAERRAYNFDIEALALRWRDMTRRYGDFFTEDEAGKGRALIGAAAGENCPRVLRLLAIEAEWKGGDFAAALDYAQRILSLESISPGLEEDTLRRLERLGKKLALAAGR